MKQIRTEHYAYLIAALAVALPWGKILFLTINGLQADRGYVGLPLLLVAAALAFTERARRTRITLAGIAALLAIWFIIDVSTTIGTSPSIGPFITAAAAGYGIVQAVTQKPQPMLM